jgi:5'-methylthioadenosine phosphorylase
MMREPVHIGVIGGSGLYSMPDLTPLETVELDTPFGKPSSPIIIGALRGRRVAFLARHGVGHVYTPSSVPYRANIYAMKQLGVRRLVAVNACGSLREDYAPGDVVIPDQLLDYTKDDRGRSFFDTGMVAHVSVADPFCAALGAQAAESIRAAGGTAREGGLYVTIEGPRFSTRSESQIFRALGCSIIGMTTCPEAFLAREAEISYTTIAHITDYDVWHMTEEVVTSDLVIQRVHDNVAAVQRIIAAAVERIDEDADFASHHALDGAFMTAPGKLSRKMIDRLAPILRDRFSAP